MPNETILKRTYRISVERLEGWIDWVAVVRVYVSTYGCEEIRDELTGGPPYMISRLSLFDKLRKRTMETKITEAIRKAAAWVSYYERDQRALDAYNDELSDCISSCNKYAEQLMEFHPAHEAN